MKIEKFSKQRSGMYLLTLEDNSKIKIHENLILKYELLLTKKVNDATLEELYRENKVYEIYELALKYLNVRLRSKKELSLYLSKKGFDTKDIDTVIEMLVSQGYLDDRVYATSFVHNRISLSSYGPLKIKKELLDSGISNEVVEEVISVFTEELEKEKIKKIIDKQVKSNHNKGAMLLKKKIQSYLLNLGYSSFLVNQSLNGMKLVDESLYQKEYDKLHTKLSRKYSGKELEYKLKQKMYQKGFTTDFME